MATNEQVRHYLIHWFLLGRKVFINNGQNALLPEPVFQGERCSPAFERCWQQILDARTGDCYLESTQQTIAQLLTPAWEIHDCARCGMPVPLPDLGLPNADCPCCELPSWPNTNIPLPRLPANSHDRLSSLCDRLLQQNPPDSPISPSETETPPPIQPSTTLPIS